MRKQRIRAEGGSPRMLANLEGVEGVRLLAQLHGVLLVRGSVSLLPGVLVGGSHVFVPFLLVLLVGEKHSHELGIVSLVLAKFRHLVQVVNAAIEHVLDRSINILILLKMVRCCYFGRLRIIVAWQCI
jgi:hypothetical protein